MKHEAQKITHLVSELLSYLICNGAKDLNIDFHHDDKCSKVIFTQEHCTYSKSFIEDLEHGLNAQRQTEVEGYYWELVGTDDVCNEIHLVGAMIDEAEVFYENETLKIEITRNCN